MRISAKAFGGLVLAASAAACELPIGPSPEEFLEVAWLIDAVDGRPHEYGHLSFRLPDYQLTTAAGVTVTCRPTFGFGPIGRWGWVERTSTGKVLGALTGPEGGPTDLFDFSIQTYCGTDSPLTVSGRMRVEVTAGRDPPRLQMGAVGWGAVYGDFFDAAEFDRWIQVRLPSSASLGEVVRIPVDVTLEVRNRAGGAGEVVWQENRTLVLDYRRWERPIGRYPDR